MTLPVQLEFTEEKLELLKNTICKGVTDENFGVFIHVCKHTGLDPFRKQIYAVMRGGQMTIQTGIDGFRLIAERTGKYSPGKEPTYTYDQTGNVASATAYIKKMTADGTWHEVSSTAFYKEYVQSFGGKPSQFWHKMPHNQLAKCAEALVLRKAFPSDMSGIYTTEEMAQSDVQEIFVTPVKEEQPDIDENAIQDHIKENWKDQETDFFVWFENLRDAKSWTRKKALEMICKNPEHTKKTFEEWLKNRSET